MGRVGQADHGYMVPEPDRSVRPESLTYRKLVASHFRPACGT